MFSEGFDLDGNYLSGLTGIGFDTVEVGPISLMPSCNEENRIHFGSKIPLANVNTLS